MSNGFLIYLKGLRGPETQKWADNDKSRRSETAPPILAEHALKPGELRMSFRELEMIYPPPACPDVLHEIAKHGVGAVKEKP